MRLAALKGTPHAARGLWRSNKCIRLEVVVQVEIGVLTKLPGFVIFLFTNGAVERRQKRPRNRGLLLFMQTNLEVIGVKTQMIANKRGNKIIAVIVAFMLTQGQRILIGFSGMLQRLRF